MRFAREVGEILDAIKNKIDGGAEGLLTDAGDAIKGAVDGAGDAVASAFGNAGEAIDDAVGGAVDNAGDAVAGAFDSAGDALGDSLEGSVFWTSGSNNKQIKTFKMQLEILRKNSKTRFTQSWMTSMTNLRISLVIFKSEAAAIFILLRIFKSWNGLPGQWFSFHWFRSSSTAFASENKLRSEREKTRAVLPKNQ
jgi:hypothetical protein